MRRSLPTWLALALLLGLPVAVAARAGAPNPVYTPAQLRANLARDPTAWVGRTVLVRGVVVSYLGAHTIPTFVTGKDTVLPRAVGLTWGPEDPVMSVLRRLPVVGRFAPAPQQVRWDADAVYRVQLHAMAGSFVCPTPPCYEATLLDTAPYTSILPSIARAPISVMPIPVWRGVMRPAPIPPWRGALRVVPLPYKRPIARQR